MIGREIKWGHESDLFADTSDRSKGLRDLEGFVADLWSFWQLPIQADRHRDICKLRNKGGLRLKGTISRGMDLPFGIIGTPYAEIRAKRAKSRSFNRVEDPDPVQLCLLQLESNAAGSGRNRIKRHQVRIAKPSKREIPPRASDRFEHRI